MTGGHGQEAGTGSSGYLARQAAAGLSPAVPFLFPGGEDDIFRDPFGDFLPSSR